MITDNPNENKLYIKVCVRTYSSGPSLTCSIMGNSPSIKASAACRCANTTNFAFFWISPRVPWGVFSLTNCISPAMRNKRAYHHKHYHGNVRSIHRSIRIMVISSTEQMPVVDLKMNYDGGECTGLLLFTPQLTLIIIWCPRPVPILHQAMTNGRNYVSH